MTDTTLRSRLAAPPILVAPGVYDALTAHLAERAGFSAVYVSRTIFMWLLSRKGRRADALSI